MATPNRTASILDDLIQGAKQDFHTSRTGYRKAIFRDIPRVEGRSVVGNIGGFVGRVASDVVGDESRNWLWGNNHPLAVSSFTGQDALKVNGMPIGYQALGGAALALGVMPITSGNFDVGNLGEFGRPKGYQALFADPTDKTKTTNPLGEFAGRYFMGRKGNILPYEELVKERPDVTPDKYAAAVQSGGFMAKDFFGLQYDPTKSIALGLGAGALLGAYGRRGKYTRGADGRIKVEPRVVLEPQAINTASGRYWADVPVGVELGNASGLTAGALKGAAIGTAVGAVLPSFAQLGFVKTQKSLDGQDAISLLGYEVPMSAALLTAGAGVGLNYWARNKFKPNAQAMADINAVRNAPYSQKNYRDKGVRYSNVNGRNTWDYVGGDVQMDLGLGV